MYHLDLKIWHKDLISVLPDKLLDFQWIDCCEIARRIALNDRFENAWQIRRVLDYPIEEFWAYARKVYFEFQSRGMDISFASFSKWFDKEINTRKVNEDDIFRNWHSRRYLWQCYSVLEELMDCGEIDLDEWIPIAELMSGVMIIE